MLKYVSTPDGLKPIGEALNELPNAVAQVVTALTNNPLADGVGDIAASIAAKNYSEAFEKVMYTVVYVFIAGGVFYYIIVPIGQSLTRLLQ